MGKPGRSLAGWLSRNVYGEHGLLRLVLANLIDNALKYTRKRPRAEISINKVPSGEGVPHTEDVFYVRDNGCGFNPSEAGSLFFPFNRLHQDKEYEGTGIGLANVKKILVKHHGRIWFESRPDDGATFFFALPKQCALDSARSDIQVVTA
jgi:light-regulated signal transduction histidine kinase (bacteriophytochrome)